MDLSVFLVIGVVLITIGVFIGTTSKAMLARTTDRLPESMQDFWKRVVTRPFVVVVGSIIGGIGGLMLIWGVFL